MTIFKYVNSSINKQAKKYTSEMTKTSDYFKKGNKKCSTKRDNHIMLTRDVATITNKKTNKRQDNLKVNLVMVVGFYVMLIYFLFDMLL